MDTVDAVSEAIWRAHTFAQPHVLPVEMAEVSRDSYRRMAQAAIDALGLTEEWGTSPDNTDAEGNPLYEPKGPVTYGDTESQAREHAARFNGHPWSRLVSGWVRKDNTNE